MAEANLLLQRVVLDAQPASPVTFWFSMKSKLTASSSVGVGTDSRPDAPPSTTGPPWETGGPRRMSKCPAGRLLTATPTRGLLPRQLAWTSGEPKKQGTERTGIAASTRCRETRHLETSGDKYRERKRTWGCCMGTSSLTWAWGTKLYIK